MNLFSLFANVSKVVEAILQLYVGLGARCGIGSEWPYAQYVVFAHWMLCCQLHRSGLNVYNAYAYAGSVLFLSYRIDVKSLLFIFSFS